MAEIPTELEDSTGRKIKLTLPDAGDTFDLIELAGFNAENRMWMYRAMAVYSAAEIDGVPIPRPRSVKDLKANARKLGDPGLSVIMTAMFPPRDDDADAEMVAAKNSVGTP